MAPSGFASATVVAVEILRNFHVDAPREGDKDRTERKGYVVGETIEVDVDTADLWERQGNARRAAPKSDEAASE